MDFAVASGRTLKPIMMALEADARVTSDSLMAPTPPWITFTTTSSLDSFSTAAMAVGCSSAAACISSPRRQTRWKPVSRSTARV